MIPLDKQQLETLVHAATCWADDCAPILEEEANAHHVDPDTARGFRKLNDALAAATEILGYGYTKCHDYDRFIPAAKAAS